MKQNHGTLSKRWLMQKSLVGRDVSCQRFIYESVSGSRVERFRLSDWLMPSLLALLVAALVATGYVVLHNSERAVVYVITSEVSSVADPLMHHTQEQSKPEYFSVTGNPAVKEPLVSSIVDSAISQVKEPVAEPTATPEKAKPATPSFVAGRVIKVRAGLNLRVEPKLGSAKILSMPKGANLKIYGKSGSWYRVEYAGKMGWAWSRYVETSGAVASVSLKSVRNAKPVHSVKKLGRAGIVLADVPQISQNTKDPYGEGRGWRPQGYCGPAALQMVLAYYGTYKSRDYLALTHPVTGEEIRASEYKGQMYIKGLGSVYRPMVQMARSLGFARTHQVWTRSVDKLKALIVQGRPQIVSMKGKILYQDGKTWDSEGHIVVVCGVTEKGDVIINDPAGDGSRRVMSKNVFEKIWKGFSIDVRL